MDSRLEDMQRRKKEVISGALDERALLNSLSELDVMELFGNVHFDKQSKRPLIAMEPNELADSIVLPVPEDEDDPVIAGLGTRF